MPQAMSSTMKKTPSVTLSQKFSSPGLSTV